jgi:hypothetical protein
MAAHLETTRAWLLGGVKKFRDGSIDSAQRMAQ